MSLVARARKAIIDTGCGRCVIGALTLEAHRSVMGDQAKEIVWHYVTPSVVSYYGKGTKDRSISVIDLPCVVGGQNMQIKTHAVPGEAPRLPSKSWLKENGAVLNTSSEELLLLCLCLCLSVLPAHLAQRTDMTAQDVDFRERLVAVVVFLSSVGCSMV